MALLAHCGGAVARWTRQGLTAADAARPPEVRSHRATGLGL